MAGGSDRWLGNRVGGWGIGSVAGGSDRWLVDTDLNKPKSTSATISLARHLKWSFEWAGQRGSAVS